MVETRYYNVFQDFCIFPSYPSFLWLRVFQLNLSKSLYSFSFSKKKYFPANELFIEDISLYFWLLAFPEASKSLGWEWTNSSCFHPSKLLSITALLWGQWTLLRKNQMQFQQQQPPPLQRNQRPISSKGAQLSMLNLLHFLLMTVPHGHISLSLRH